MQNTSKKLESSYKSYQDELKEITISRLKMTEAKDSLFREIEMKNEENKLLTKKIYEQELIISKIER